MFLHPVAAEMDAAMLTLLRLVHAQHQVRTEVLTLTGMATAVGAVYVHQFTDTSVALRREGGGGGVRDRGE